MRRIFGILIFSMTSLGFVACDGGTEGDKCSSGATVECSCLGAVESVRTCVDGQWEDCFCAAHVRVYHQTYRDDNPETPDDESGYVPVVFEVGADPNTRVRFNVNPLEVYPPYSEDCAVIPSGPEVPIVTFPEVSDMDADGTWYVNVEPGANYVLGTGYSNSGLPIGALVEMPGVEACEDYEIDTDSSN